MDPEQAVDELKDRVRVAEKLIEAALRRRDENYMVSAHEELTEAGTYVTALSEWVKSGGFKPRRMDTWVRRYIKVFRHFNEVAERISQGAWY